MCASTSASPCCRLATCALLVLRPAGDCRGVWRPFGRIALLGKLLLVWLLVAAVRRAQLLAAMRCGAVGCRNRIQQQRRVEFLAAQRRQLFVNPLSSQRLLPCIVAHSERILITGRTCQITGQRQPHACMLLAGVAVLLAAMARGVCSSHEGNSPKKHTSLWHWSPSLHSSVRYFCGCSHASNT